MADVVNAFQGFFTVFCTADIAELKLVGRMVFKQIHVALQAGGKVIKYTNLSGTMMEQVGYDMGANKARATGYKKRFIGKAALMKKIHGG